MNKQVGCRVHGLRVYGMGSGSGLRVEDLKAIIGYMQMMVRTL